MPTFRDQATIFESRYDEGDTFTQFKPTGEASSSYIDYIYRDPKLDHFCLYEYMSQIGICTRRIAPRNSVSFAAGHPKVDTYRQYSASLRQHGSDDDGDIDGLWVPAIYSRLADVNNRGDSSFNASWKIPRTSGMISLKRCWVSSFHGTIDSFIY